jgi:hypothetical protein
MKVNEGVVRNRSHANDADARMRQDAAMKENPNGDCNAEC